MINVKQHNTAIFNGGKPNAESFFLNQDPSLLRRFSFQDAVGESAANPAYDNEGLSPVKQIVCLDDTAIASSGFSAPPISVSFSLTAEENEVDEAVEVVNTRSDETLFGRVKAIVKDEMLTFLSHIDNKQHLTELSNNRLVSNLEAIHTGQLARFRMRAINYSNQVRPKQKMISCISPID